MARPKDTSSRSWIAKICDGRVRLERLKNTTNISARCSVQGRQVRKSLKTRNISEARRLATQWWSELVVRSKQGERIHAPTFHECAIKFLASRARDAADGTISHGQHQQLVWKEALLRPFIGHLRVDAIDAQTLLDLRAQRAQHKNNRGERLTNSTLKKDFVFIHSALAFAKDRLKVIRDVPPSPPFTGSKAVIRRGRPYLNEAEYQKLIKLAKERAEEPQLNDRTRRQRYELYLFILISVGGALRVGEAESVRWCDCERTELTPPDGSIRPAVLMRVLGKHSRHVGGAREEAYVAFGGVWAFEELQARRSNNSADTDAIFSETHRDGMTELLKAASLYEYTDPLTGNTLTRNRKSLRPTAITMRLEKGDNISYRDIAWWARTKPQMIADYYDQLHPADAAARVMTFRKKEPQKKTAQQTNKKTRL